MVCLKQGRWGRTRDLLLLSQTDMEQFTILLNLTTANLSDALSLFQSIGGSKKGVSVNHSKKNVSNHNTNITSFRSLRSISKLTPWFAGS